MALLFFLAGCGSNLTDILKGGPSNTDGGGASGTDMSNLGVDTATIVHDEYVASANHSLFTCEDCHVQSGALDYNADSYKAICSTYCHPLTRYSANATNFDHTTNNTGSHCNKCHSSIEVGNVDEYPPVSGWRKNMRIDYIDFHDAVDGVCLDCHETASVVNFPASHESDSTRQTACESCHYYKAESGVGKWAGGHTNVTSGCDATGCHTVYHYSGHGCEECHESSIANGYTSWTGWWNRHNHSQMDSASCSACHDGGGEGDDDSDDDDGDDGDDD